MFIRENLEEKQHVYHEHYKIFSSIHLQLKIVFN